MFLSILLTKKTPRHSMPVRLLHWCYAPAVLAGFWSGLYINNPSRSLGFKSMEHAQKTHFIAQYVLLSSFLARVYNGYVTKNYREIIPDRKALKDMPKFMKYELFLTKRKPEFPKYNPAQKVIFTGLALLIPLQILTGFGLYSSKTFQKTVDMAGGLNPLRKLHYLLSLSISSLAAGHIYFALTDSLRKLKSIFTGYK